MSERKIILPEVQRGIESGATELKEEHNSDSPNDLLTVSSSLHQVVEKQQLMNENKFKTDLKVSSSPDVSNKNDKIFKSSMVIDCSSVQGLSISLRPSKSEATLVSDSDEQKKESYNSDDFSDYSRCGSESLTKRGSGSSHDDTDSESRERRVSGSGSSSSSEKEMKKILPKKFFCKTCNQGFTRKHNMISHELIHSTSKAHYCTTCSLKFRRYHDLKRHEKSHTGEKPFRCGKCGRKFARLDALSRHKNSASACSSTLNNLTKLSSAMEIEPVPEPLNRNLQNVNPANEYLGWRTPQLSLLQHGNPLFPTASTTTAVSTQNKSSQGQFAYSNMRLTGETDNKVFQASGSPQASFCSTPQPTEIQNKLNFINYPYAPPPPPPSTMHPLSNPKNYLQHFLTTPVHHHHHHYSNFNPGEQNPISISKYQDLVNYTHELQNNLSKLNSRIQFLENVEARHSLNHQLNNNINK